MQAMTQRALLLIAHGTRNPAVVGEADALCDLVAERLDIPVAMSWVEWDLIEPSPADAAVALHADGAEELVTLPLLAFAAGHTKTDVPEELAGITEALPDLPRRHGRVLGVHPSLTEHARSAIVTAREEAGWPERPGEDEALLLTGPGSSDPDANGELAKAARFVAEVTGHRWVEIAFAGVTWPKADVAVRRLIAGGAQRVSRFSWSLLAGVLEERVDGMIAEAAADSGLAVANAGRFGPIPALADAVADRYAEAVHGDPRSNCDLCQFRIPLAGRQARAGLPSAGGTGERVHPTAELIQAARQAMPTFTDWKRAQLS